jgi:RNA polymerase sigma-70 factor, ECF subfamily
LKPIPWNEQQGLTLLRLITAVAILFCLCLDIVIRFRARQRFDFEDVDDGRREWNKIVIHASYILDRLVKRELKIYTTAQTTVEEQHLVVSAAQGNREALHSLYEMHRDRLYRLLYRLCGDARLAEDLLQEVFLKAFKSLSRFRFQCTFSSWIYRIALNEAKYQKRQTKKSLSLEAIFGSSFVTDPSPDQLGVNISRQRQSIVWKAILTLAPKLRSVIVLKYVEGLSYDEIAEIMDCSPGTVASRLSRALAKLERLLRPFEKIL